MLRLLCGGVLLSGLLSLVARCDEEATMFPIAETGQPRCVIVVADEPSPAERTAASELQAILEEVTGAVLSVKTSDDVPLDAPQIVVGPSTRLTELTDGLDLDALGADGIVIRTKGDALILAGPRPRGTLYAVYSFLEDSVGCRWWTSSESTIPSKPTLSVPPLDITYTPKLKSRMAYYRDAFVGQFASRMKLNGSSARLDESLGGNVRFAMFVHTFYPLLPPETYFDEHPEWYSLINGKRTHDRAQLCLTNDAMRAELTRNVLARLRRDPGAKLISVSQNDWHNPCGCDACGAVVEEEGSEAGPLLRFVNAVAADVEQEFPDVWVETLAYQYTRKAPRKVRPRDNVVVRLCSIECSFVQTLDVGDQNEAFRDDMVAWSRIAPKLFVWDYVTNFSNYLVPHPNLRVLGPNLRFFVDHGTVGLFEQGDSQSGVGDFVALRAWLLAHLMWNPQADEQALIGEFLKGYYGPAAEPLAEYLDLINDAGERSEEYIRCFMPNTASWLTSDDLRRATEIFTQAEAAVADNPTLAARVRRERLPLDHVWLSRYHALRQAAMLREQPFLGPTDPASACEEFLRVCRANGVGNWRERHPFDERADALRRMFGPPAKPPKEVAELKETDWLDFQDGRFRLHTSNGWAKPVEDPHASDGRAARMGGEHRQWAVSLPFSEDLSVGNPWHVYVAARCDATTEEGRAMSMGIYDHAAKKSAVHRYIEVSEASGQAYRIIDLGEHELNGTMYLWAAPPERPDEVQHVYVDRVFLIRGRR